MIKIRGHKSNGIQFGCERYGHCIVWSHRLPEMVEIQNRKIQETVEKEMTKYLKAESGKSVNSDLNAEIAKMRVCVK